MRKVNDNLRKRILKMWEHGLGKQEIADKVGLSRSTVRRVVDPEYAEHIKTLRRLKRNVEGSR